MPEAASRRFIQLFQKALSQSGRLEAKDVSALLEAQRSIRDETERAAAESILALLRHDRELDRFEVAPARKALSVLLGISNGPLPKDLERVLARAVPQANVQVRHYDLTFDLSGPGPSFPARARIELDRPAPKRSVLEVHPDRLEIQSVRVRGRDVPFQIRDGRLLVDAPKARSLDIAYTVKAVDATSREAYGLVRDKYGGRIWTLTWPYNTGALFPSNSLPSDGATSRVTLQIAEGTTAIATGARKGSSFSLDAETPAYAIGFYAATDFELGNAGRSKDGIRVVGAGIANEVPKRIRDAYRKTAREALDFYSSWLGPYDFGPSLHLVETEGELGGMEHASAVAIMLGAAKDAEDSKETAAHEVAHHWFGDNLRIEHWGDFWMSEGFTNYATYRFFRYAEGDQKFFAFLDRAKDEVQSALKQNPHALIAPRHTDVNEIFDSVSYEMGAWMLRMLEARFGTERFDDLLRDWFRSRRGQAVSTEDFVAFAREKTGADLKPFFDAWNRITAVPSFDATVQVDGSKVEVSMKAKTDFPRGLELPLLVEGPQGQRKTFWVDPSRRTTFDAGFPVRSYRWDPERTVMAYIS